MLISMGQFDRRAPCLTDHRVFEYVRVIADEEACGQVLPRRFKRMRLPVVGMGVRVCFKLLAVRPGWQRHDIEHRAQRPRARVMAHGIVHFLPEHGSWGRPAA